MKPLCRQSVVILLALLSVQVSATTLFVDVNGTNSLPPYINWETAATNIQDAVQLAQTGDTVLVTNGVYQTGGMSNFGSNRVNINKAIAVRSINGPAMTVIKGNWDAATNGPDAVRCVYLSSGATLSGFTLTNGATAGWLDGVNGGGACCESTNALVYNCILTGNTAFTSGGGAYSGTLNRCILIGNFSVAGGGADSSTLNNSIITSNSVSPSSAGGGYGGGAYHCLLSNCTVVGNHSTRQGGGADSSTLNNCILYFNTSPSSPNSNNNFYLTNCCMNPLPPYGVGNITNEPAFLNLAGGNFHLQSNSPCINAGNNAAVVGSTDFDGNARIVGGTVDIGAYECVSPALLDFYTWLQNYGLPTDTSAFYTDTDGDGMNNWQEWVAGTNPVDATSLLKMLAPSFTVSGTTVQWQSVSGKTYFIQRSSDLSVPTSFSTLQGNLAGHAGTTTYTDLTATGPGPFFYRVGVQ